MTTVLPNGEIQSNPKIAYNKGYEKGRADAYSTRRNAKARKISKGSSRLQQL